MAGTGEKKGGGPRTRIPHKTSTPRAVRQRRQREFQDFMAAYQRWRKKPSLVSGNQAAEALRICMPQNGKRGLEGTFELLEQLGRAEYAAWANVLAQAIESELDTKNFKRLKRLFEPRLLAARAAIRKGKIILSGLDADAVWDYMLEGRPLPPYLHPISKEDHLILANT